MKAVYFEREQAAHFPALGLTLQPGINELADEHAAAALALPTSCGIRAVTDVEPLEAAPAPTVVEGHRARKDKEK